MSRIELALQCQSDGSDVLASELSKITGESVDQAELDNLDGTPSTILQVVQIGVSLVAAVAPIIAAYISSRKVKKVKLGSIEVENPTPEQWERLWKYHLESTKKEGSFDSNG